MFFGELLGSRGFTGKVERFDELHDEQVEAVVLRFSGRKAFVGRDGAVAAPLPQKLCSGRTRRGR